ncbi:MAG: hypothetical protein SF182_11860 [Deltaproteobacteria bacterium]|nr:hypothetical protein [Deltaproteobacteria bacterium]
MDLAPYYFDTAGVLLVPIEHLAPDGVSAEFAAAAVARGAWSPAQVTLFDAGFARYWRRTAALAARTATWAPPRLRHVALLADHRVAHPYVQLLNTSAWTLYASDLDPVRADPEWLAYLLAHGDRMATTGEVTAAALRNAAWWLERSDAQCAAFAAAAAGATRPDADAFRLLAAALPWLRRLGHGVLRPLDDPHARAIPDTELHVPAALVDEPPRLLQGWTAVAQGVVAAHAAAWRAPQRTALAALADWLVAQAPALLVTAGERVIWDGAEPRRVDALRRELTRAAGAAVRDIQADLAAVADATARCAAAFGDLAALPASPDAEQRGYVYMHRARRQLAYNLDEPGAERRTLPALPFARAMLAARAVHEWAHRAVEAGQAPCRVEEIELARRVDALAAELTAVVTAAPAAPRAAAQADLDALCASEDAEPGTALARLLLRRLPDYRANLLAMPLLDQAERETYVRQNIRTLRAEYPAARRWRLLVRYLYEYQYLRFSAVADRRTFFWRSTWFDADFIDTGILDAGRFAALDAAVAAVCGAYAAAD